MVYHPHPTMSGCRESKESREHKEHKEAEHAAPAAPVRKFGWLRQPHDPRDRVYRAVVHEAALPTTVDLRTKVKQPPIFDQGQLGSCVANATAYAHQYDKYQQYPTYVTSPESRLFIYYGAREIIGTVNQDSGCYIRDGIKILNQKGVCKETTWPYDISQFKVRPSSTSYTEAATSKAVEYSAVQVNVASIKQALFDGHPVVFGFDVYSSFNNIGANGMMPIPNPRTEQQLGGHAVAAVGYDDNLNGGCFIVRNSWGTNWGAKGYFYMPYGVVTGGFTSDYWIVTKAIVPNPPTPDPPGPTPVPIADILKLLDGIDANTAAIRAKLKTVTIEKIDK